MAKMDTRQRGMTAHMRVFLVALSCMLAVTLAGPISAYAAIQTNYSWYKGHEAESSYSISTAGEMKALSKLVAGTADYDGDGKVDAAVDFAGKTIVLTEGAPVNFMREAIEPIGTADHPFQGTFDGTARQVDNFVLNITASSTASVQNVGLFGYVGEQGRLVGVSIGRSASISIVRGDSSTDYIANVGMVAGYCGGTMAGCSNAGTLTVASEVVQKSKKEFLPVRNIGGVAGTCVFDMAGCSNSGNVSVSETSSPVVAIDNARLAGRIGGVVGLLGDETRLGDHETHIYGEADKHGAIDGCTNTGKVVVDTPKLSGLDRFGVQTNAESVYVGGVVGYSQGSITNCTNGIAQATAAGESAGNVGYVRAENGYMVGGVCGSLRGVAGDNVNVAYADDGADGADPLLISHCANYGDVYARVTAGGIVGKAGSYTTVTECLNSTKRDFNGGEVPTYIVATRWNKPSPGGIAGTAEGEVSYCANLGTIASATWDNEALRTLSTQDGYYAAGIVGMLTHFDDQAVAHGGVATPISEVFSCYNAGEIIAGSNMRQRGIVGENDGFVYNNVLVEGLVYNDDLVYGDDADETEASGAVGENRVYDARELRGDKAAEAVAFMNANSQANGWLKYWILPVDATKAGLNAGYPLLDSQNPWGATATSIVDARTELVSDAEYTGGESVPSVRVTLGTVQLTENADYRVIPQKDAVEPTVDRPYSATVVGLGRYYGTAAQTVPYGIVAGDFSKCTLTVEPHTFDYEQHVPAASDVTVRTPAGTTVDSSEYTFELVDEVGDPIEAPVDADKYRIIAKANEESVLFTGSKSGTFRIKPASFMREVKFDGVTISYQGEEHPWVNSTEKGESDNPSTALRYTGSPVKPEVGAVTYKGHTLVEGKDYKVVYGNPNSDDGYMGDQDANNAGKKGGTTVGCITVRYITGAKTNFTSYANMFFRIVDDGKKTDLSLAHAVVDGEQVSDGQPLEPVELWLDRSKLTKGVDYTIEYEDNVEPGTARFRAVGIGGFVGELTGTFEIVSKSGYDFTYSYAGTGTDEDPFEATVTGVEYTGSRETFHMVIPETVLHDGNVYTVTAIADDAFGGKGLSDFEGTLAKESKLKIESAFIPATVRAIGARAFGVTTEMATAIPLKSVEVGAGSQLESVGEQAFSYCRNLVSFTFPEKVNAIGNYAFRYCTGLTELRFLTEDAALPATIGRYSFLYCKGAVVRGFDTAAAVKAFAEANSKATVGANGGISFTFEPLESIAAAQMTAPSDQLYTGKAHTPKVAVTLGGTRLVEGTDYEIAYENNVNAGTARVVARGIGAKGGQVVRTFTIAKANIARAASDRIGDIAFTGQPVELALDLTFDGMALSEGVDFDLAYRDLAGNEIEAPSAAGSYHLVATGKGNFSGMLYRAFRIVAPSLADADIAPIGNKLYAGGAAVEPEPDVSVGGAALVRDRDFTVSYANNTQVGEATMRIFGIGGYEGEAELRFPIVAAPLDGAAIAGVADVQATGEPVSFEPTVVVDGVRLAEGADYTVSYQKRVESNGSDGGSDEGAESGVGTGSGVGGQALSLTLSAQEDAKAEYEAIDSAPSEVGDYRLVATAVGQNYEGTAHCAFSITQEAPAERIDLAAAGAVVSCDAERAYTGQAQAAVTAVELSGTVLAEGTDYIVAYAGNIDPGEATATIYGIGKYSGSLVEHFTVQPVEITASCVKPLPDVEYTGGAITPHPVVSAAGRTLGEGVDYTVAYAGNTAVSGDGAPATCTIAAIGRGYSGTVEMPFNIVRADLSRADVSLSFTSATYTGREVKPSVSVKLGNRLLSAGTDYAVAYSENVKVGTASVTVSGVGSYTGEAVAHFAIRAIEVARPTAKTGLVYTGSTLAGVAPNAAYALAGATAVNAGSYTATATLREGYTWPGGFTAPVKLSWSIARASLGSAKMTLAKASAVYTGKAQKGAVKSVVVGARTLTGADYTVSAASGTATGSYKVTLTGKGNYTGSAATTFTITKAANPLKASAKTVKLKAKKVKKAKQTVTAKKSFTVKKAQGKVTYKKKSGNKKITVSSAGKVTVKKGLKKGTYKVKVAVTAKGNANYKKGAKTVTLKVKIA